MGGILYRARVFQYTEVGAISRSRLAGTTNRELVLENYDIGRVRHGRLRLLILVYKRNMKRKAVLRVLEVTAIVLVAPIIGQVMWPARTTWGFPYSLGFSLIGGIALGILVERFSTKQESTTVKPIGQG